MNTYSLLLNQESKAVLISALNSYYMKCPVTHKDQVKELRDLMVTDDFQYSIFQDSQEVLIAALKFFRSMYMRNYEHINRNLKYRCSIAWNLIQRLNVSDADRRRSNPRFKPYDGGIQL